MSKRRVVVTGLGAVTPIGNNVEDFWAGIREGKVGIGPITKFDTTDYKVKIAAEVKDFNAKDHMDPRAARRMDPFCPVCSDSSKRMLLRMLALIWKKRILSVWVLLLVLVSEVFRR